MQYDMMISGGRDGVPRAAELLRDEILLALPMLGCASLSEVRRELVAEATGAVRG